MEPANKRLNVRMRASDDLLIRRAAAVVGESVTDYVTTSAVERAHAILADQRRFVLSGKQWEVFLAGFDRPAQYKPEVARLLATELPES